MLPRLDPHDLPDVMAEDVSGGEVVIRPLASADSFEALTALLHRAYAPLGALGLNYTAVDQTVEVTRRRCAAGECLVLEHDGRLAGTITIAGPHDPVHDAWALQTPWLWRADTAYLNQLAVEPALQRRGLGRRLVGCSAQWARERGYRYLALDTAVPAAQLRRYYERLGFFDADEVQWRGKRYRSLVMARPIDGAPWPAVLEPTAQVRALWARMQARDWTGVGTLFARQAKAVWWTSGERFLDRDAIVRVNEMYPAGWSISLLEANLLADGRVHSLVRVDHPPHAFYANSFFRFDGPLIAAVDEYWATCERPPAWRDAQAIGAYERFR